MFASSNILQVLWGQSYVLVFVVFLCVLSHVRLFETPWTVAHQAPLSMGFVRQEYWSGLPFHFSRGASQPRVQTCIPCISGRLFTTEPRRKSPCLSSYCFLSLLAWILAFLGLWIFFFLWFVDLLHQSTSLSLFRSYFSLLLFVKLTFKLDNFG